MEERTRNYSRKKRRPDPDTHKKVSKWNALIFFGFIVVADVVLLLSHGRVFSDTENRMLQQAPSLSMQSLTSGKFMNQFEDFVSDQFMARNGWIYSKLKMDKILGKKESNGVFLADAGYLVEATAAPDEERVSRNVTAINQFAGANPGINVVMTIVPNSSEINQSLLPAGAPLRNQREDIGHIASQLSGDVTFADVSDVLQSHSQEDLYYKSDHHWTSLGAYYAWQAIALALQTPSDDEYQVLTVADDFSGTMASTSGDYNVYDKVDIYVNQPEVDYYVEYSGDPVKYSSIYRSEALEQKNKYEVFFGGNFPKITITTLNETGKNLLVLKDSYANCFIQFLLPHYDHIIMVDPRYYSDDLEAELNASDITDVLILYNENTFVQDNSLAGVLISEDEGAGVAETEDELA